MNLLADPAATAGRANIRISTLKKTAADNRWCRDFLHPRRKSRTADGESRRLLRRPCQSQMRKVDDRVRIGSFGRNGRGFRRRIQFFHGMVISEDGKSRQRPNRRKNARRPLRGRIPYFASPTKCTTVTATRRHDVPYRDTVFHKLSFALSIFSGEITSHVDDMFVLKRQTKASGYFSNASLNEFPAEKLPVFFMLFFLDSTILLHSPF